MVFLESRTPMKINDVSGDGMSVTPAEPGLHLHVVRWRVPCTLCIAYHLAAFQRKTQRCSLTQSETTSPSSDCFDWRPGPLCSQRLFYKWSFRISLPQSYYSFLSFIHTVAIIQEKYRLYSKNLSVLPLTHSFK